MHKFITENKDYTLFLQYQKNDAPPHTEVWGLLQALVSSKTFSFWGLKNALCILEVWMQANSTNEFAEQKIALCNFLVFKKPHPKGCGFRQIPWHNNVVWYEIMGFENADGQKKLFWERDGLIFIYNPLQLVCQLLLKHLLPFPDIYRLLLVL